MTDYHSMWHKLLVKFFRFWCKVGFGGWFDLVYRTKHTTTGFLIKVGLGLSIYAGWRVQEGQPFPFGFSIFLFDRLDFGDSYHLLSADITLFGRDKHFRFGTVKASELLFYWLPR